MTCSPPPRTGSPCRPSPSTFPSWPPLSPAAPCGNLISALRCLYNHAVDDRLIDEKDNPARKVDKPRRLPSTRRALDGAQLAEINRVVTTTGNDDLRAMDRCRAAVSPGQPLRAAACDEARDDLSATASGARSRGTQPARPSDCDWPRELAVLDGLASLLTFGSAVPRNSRLPGSSARSRSRRAGQAKRRTVREIQVDLVERRRAWRACLIVCARWRPTWLTCPRRQSLALAAIPPPAPGPVRSGPCRRRTALPGRGGGR